MIIALDLDGTLCNTPEGINYEDEAEILARCTPRYGVIARVLELHALGHDLAVVTARGPQVANATKRQLRDWLGDLNLVVRHRPRIDFSWQHYVADKEEQFRKLGADICIGDRPEDKAAALRANAHFLWDWEFETHGIVQLRPRAKLQPEATV
jgi:phosphoglycolate phosphatase-like HAD superfamily hydrolase